MTIIKNLTYEEYDKMDGISNSKLSKIAISPAHFQQYINEPPKETDALRFGSLLHCLILDPQNFEKEFAIEPIVNKRTNAGKEHLAQFYEENAGKMFVTEEQVNLATILKEKIYEHPLANKLLSGKGENEIALFWTDEETNVKCKCKIDRIKNGIIIDLKSTRSAKPEDFMRDAYNYGYHRQAAFYCKGYENCYNKAPKGFVFITVEKEAPYSVAIYEATELFKEVGGLEIGELLKVYKDCMEIGEFPSYDGFEPKIHALDLPNWVLYKYGLNEEDVFNE